jgi:hypothetical protein
MGYRVAVVVAPCAFEVILVSSLLPTRGIAARAGRA